MTLATLPKWQVALGCSCQCCSKMLFLIKKEGATTWSPHPWQTSCLMQRSHFAQGNQLIGNEITSRGVADLVFFLIDLAGDLAHHHLRFVEHECIKKH